MIISSGIEWIQMAFITIPIMRKADRQTDRICYSYIAAGVVLCIIRQREWAQYRILLVKCTSTVRCIRSHWRFSNILALFFFYISVVDTNTQKTHRELSTKCAPSVLNEKKTDFEYNIELHYEISIEILQPFSVHYTSHKAWGYAIYPMLYIRFT